LVEDSSATLRDIAVIAAASANDAGDGIVLPLLLLQKKGGVTYLPCILINSDRPPCPPM
jgi:hypothetical protein